MSIPFHASIFFGEDFLLQKTRLIWIKLIDRYEDSLNANEFCYSINPYRTYNTPPYRHEV